MWQTSEAVQCYRLHSCNTVMMYFLASTFLIISTISFCCSAPDNRVCVDTPLLLAANAIFFLSFFLFSSFSTFRQTIAHVLRGNTGDRLETITRCAEWSQFSSRHFWKSDQRLKKLRNFTPPSLLWEIISPQPYKCFDGKSTSPRRGGWWRYMPAATWGRPQSRPQFLCVENPSCFEYL